MPAVTRVDTAKLDQLIVTADADASDIVRVAAYSVEAKARVNAPYDTGFHSNSIMAEEQDALTWRVSFYSEYGIWLELGTYKMAARPHLLPAVEQAERDYIEAWKRLVL